MIRLGSMFVLLTLPLLVGCAEELADGTGGKETSRGSVQQANDGSSKRPSDEDVTLKILNYQEIQDLIRSHKGKVVVMDAWSTACAPCIKEFPNLVKLHEKYGGEEVAAVSLSFDYEGIDTPEDQQERVLKFLKSQNATFDNILNKDEADVLYRKMNLDAVPAVFVFDQQGKLRQKFDSNYRNDAGERFTYADVNKLVERLLEEEKG